MKSEKSKQPKNNCKTTPKQPETTETSPVTEEIETDLDMTEITTAQSTFKPISFTKTVFENPKLPLPKSSGIRNILVTSALPYVNNIPHLGNIIGSTLSANVFALYCQLVGYNCLSLCGNDEYGTATETKAVAESLTPKEICDKYHRLHCQVYQWFDITFDYFGRTTTSEHSEIVQDLFRRVSENGYITENTVNQLFCEKCSKFLADRFVEGGCPFCKYDDARGDQCDKCGRLINAVDLIQPRCKTCTNCPIVKSSRHLFLDLPKIAPQLSTFINDRIDSPDCNWTANACTISSSWLRDGLKPRCITRDLKWGVPVPQKNYEDKVFYVWFDAPIGYLSITANYTKEWRQWWLPKPDSPVELYQFMGKDNVPFHAIIFPACMLAANQGHTMVKHLLSTEYMNYEDSKFSKSRGIGVFGDNAMTSGICSNVWRFYLLYRRPESQDSAFMWDDFVLVNNNELLNNLGNFVNRGLTFVAKFFASTIPEMTDIQSSDCEFLARVNRRIQLYVSSLENCRLREGIRHVLAITRLGNVYFQQHQPWVAVKKEETKQRAATVIGIASNVASLVGLLLYPYMPRVANHIWIDQCALSPDSFSLIPLVEANCSLCQLMPTGHKIGKPTPLFRKIEVAEIDKLSKLYKGSVNGQQTQKT